MYILLFIFIQDILPENILPISIFINIVCIYSISFIYKNLKTNYIKYFAAIILLLFYSFNFYSFFFKEFDNKNIIEKYLLSSNKNNSTPLININYTQFKQVYNFLEEKIKENPNYTISSITSDRLFDPETIIYYSLVNNKKEMIKKVINIPAPNTYGLVFNAYESNLLVVAKNWKNNTKEDYWLPIAIPHNLFKNSEGISKYYTKIFEVKTNDNESEYIYIFEKNKDIPIEKMKAILDKFIEKEPDKKKLVVSQFEEYKNNKK